MSASFDVPALAPGQATLTIMGMDSEDAAKTPMRVVVNDTVIFEGANPLPNDDIPLQSGRWDNLNLPFDTAILQAGANTVTITNLASGGVNAPPFIAVDYAIVQLP